MLKLLFQPEPIPFLTYEPDIAWLHANGVVDEVDGDVDIVVPLYKKVLVTAFRPLINGEAAHYLTSARDVVGDYLTEAGTLNLNALLTAYRAYVQRRDFRAFDTENLKEGAWHYSLDGYLHFFIERLGRQTYIEVPSGRGRTDILVRSRLSQESAQAGLRPCLTWLGRETGHSLRKRLGRETGHSLRKSCRHQAQSYIIETKVFTDETYFKRGQGQLAEYLKSEGLAEGYYVVFSHIQTAADTLYTEQTVADKRIYTHIFGQNNMQTLILMLLAGWLTIKPKLPVFEAATMPRFS